MRAPWVVAAGWLVGVCLLSTGVPVLASPSDLEGAVQVMSIDSIEPATGRPVGSQAYYLHTSSGRDYSIMAPGPQLPLLVAGSRVRISGRIHGDRIEASSISVLGQGDVRTGARSALAANDRGTTGEQRTLVALIAPPNVTDRPFGVEDIRGKVIGGPRSLDAFLRENSQGKLWLNPRFIDWTALPENGDYYSGPDASLRIIRGGITAVSSQVDLREFTRLIFVLRLGPDSHAPAGFGTLGYWDQSLPEGGAVHASVTCVRDFVAEERVFAHEFGHNLGFGHASSLNCIPESLRDPVFSCTLNSYGDDDDTMGDSSYTHFSTANKVAAGWIEERQIQDVVASGTYTLDQVELPSDGIKALRISLGSQDKYLEATYWVEYRQPIGGFDSRSAVQLRVRATQQYPSSLDMGVARFKGIHGGGRISGTATGLKDGKAALVGVEVLNEAGASIAARSTTESGFYRIGGLPAGRYRVKAQSSELGTAYYDDATDLQDSVRVTVAPGVETPSIDFRLPAAGTPLAAETVPGLRRVASPALPGPVRREVDEQSDPFARFIDIEEGRPFHDPYRGVKIELIERTGTGEKAAVRLRVQLSGLRPSVDELYLVGSNLGACLTWPVDLRNTTSRAVTVGKPSVDGRHPEQVTIGDDTCSSQPLHPGEKCTVRLRVCTSAVHDETLDAASALIPSDDDVAPLRRISLRVSRNPNDGRRVTVTISGAGSVMSDPPGINCPSADCTARFPAGTSIVLRAVRTGRDEFRGWSGTCAGSGTCRLELTKTEDTEVSAAFVRPDGLFIPQVAVGGGYTTTFQIGNPNASEMKGRLILTDKDGAPMKVRLRSAGGEVLDSTLQFSIQPAATLYVTAGPESVTASGLATGWASIEARGGVPSLGASFRFSEGGILKTAVGVLSSGGTDSATVAVDNDYVSGRFTGFAIANPGATDLYLKLSFLNRNGTVVETLRPLALNPLGPGRQLARFIHEAGIGPHLAAFRGSMVITVDGAKKFAVAALVLRNGPGTGNQPVLTVVPVSPGKPAHVD